MNRRSIIALAGGGVLLAATGVGGWRWLTRPNAVPVSGDATTTRTVPVVRATLTAREQVPGTIGYTGDREITHPGTGGTLTAAPDSGAVIERGQTLYEVDGRPVVLLYGNRPAWRELATGMSRGEDVRQLEENLMELGFGGHTVDTAFTASTASAVRRWQRHLRVSRTGDLALGSVVFAPEAVRIAEVSIPVGGRIGDTPVLRVSSTRRVVTVALPTGRATQVREGGPVEVTLPGGQRAAGNVTEVGDVAVAAESNGGPPAQPTITVIIALDQADAAGPLDQAPVQVAVTTATRTGVLAVPVTALLAADAAGGYLVTIVDGGARRRLAVRPGLLDERSGLIEVTGDGLAEGRLVEVPAR